MILKFGSDGFNQVRTIHTLEDVIDHDLHGFLSLSGPVAKIGIIVLDGHECQQDGTVVISNLAVCHNGREIKRILDIITLCRLHLYGILDSHILELVGEMCRLAKFKQRVGQEDDVIDSGQRI